MLKDLRHLRDIDPVYNDAGPFGGVTLEALHQDVSRFELPLSAPEGVRRNYDAIRHAYIFSYFSYDLVTLATNQLLPCLELALRERMQPQSGAGPRGKARGPNLQKLLSRAAKHGLLSRRHDSLHELRNMLQHGNDAIFDPNMFLNLFETVTELITELYAPSQQAEPTVADAG